MRLNCKVQEKILFKILDKADPAYFHKGNEINFRCPFCGDSQRSQNKRRGWYNLQKQTYHCFNCNVGLNDAFFKVLEAFGIKNDLNLITQIWQNENIFEEKEQVQQKQAKSKITYNNFLKNCVLIAEGSLIPHEVIEYWQNRCLDKTEYPFYYCENESRFANRIIIPFFDEVGDCIYFQARAIERGTLKYLNPKGEKDAVFNLGNIDRSRPIVVVEGPIDSLFVENSIAVMTKSIKASQMETLKDLDLIIMFDNDKDGIKAALKYCKNHKIFIYPKEFLSGEDINDFCIRKGITKLSLDYVSSNCLSNFQAEIKLKMLLNN